MTFKFLTNRKTPRHSMICRFKATFLGIAVHIHRVSTARRTMRFVEYERDVYQSPAASDSVLSFESVPVVRIPSDRPPEFFERPAGMAPDPLFEACLQMYREYYEGRLGYGPNGEPIYVAQHPDHPDTDVGMGTSGGVMSREGLHAPLSPAAAYAHAQAQKLGLSQEKFMVHSGHGDDGHIGQTSTAAATIESHDLIEWPYPEATDGFQDARLRAVHDALARGASGDLLTESTAAYTSDMPM